MLLVIVNKAVWQLEDCLVEDFVFSHKIYHNFRIKRKIPPDIATRRDILEKLLSRSI